MKLIDSIWFSTLWGNCIGIVLCEDEITKQRKAYVGIGGGENEKHDTERIMMDGAKLTDRQVEHIHNFFRSQDE